MTGFNIPFNRGRFNRKLNNYIFASADINLNLVTEGKGRSILAVLETESIRMLLVSIGEPTLCTKAVCNNMSIILLQEAAPKRLVHRGIRFTIKMNTQGEFLICIYSIIELIGFPLKSGDELVIDTENMTAVVNGINVLEYISYDSEFFKLFPDKNEFYITDDSETEQAKIKILWKDRWL